MTTELKPAITKVIEAKAKYQATLNQFHKSSRMDDCRNMNKTMETLLKAINELESVPCAIPEGYVVVENSKLLRMLELAKTHLNRLIFVAEKIGSSECDAYIKELSDCELMIIELNKTGDK